MICQANIADIVQLAEIHLEAEIASAAGADREHVVGGVSLEDKIETWQKSINSPSISIYIDEALPELNGFATFGRFRGTEESPLNIGSNFPFFKLFVIIVHSV